MARKRKKARRPRRDRKVKVDVPFTEEERATIELVAAREGMTAEEWITKAGLNAARPAPGVDDQVAEAAAKLGSLPNEDRLWLGGELADAGPAILWTGYKAGMTSPAAREAMVRGGQAFIDRVQAKVGRRFALATNETRAAIVHYFRAAITQWINEGSKHVVQMQRAAQVFPEDEFFLWTHLYHGTHDSHRDPEPAEAPEPDHLGRYDAELTSWYSGMDEGMEKQACLAAGRDFFHAYAYTGRKLLMAIVQSEQPDYSKKPGRGAVRAYLRCVKQTFEASMSDAAVIQLDRKAMSASKARSERENAERLARLLWASLRNSRVFEITEETYSAIERESITYVWSKIAGLEGGVEQERSPEELKEAQDRIWEAAGRLPVFSDIMPFDHMFFGFDTDGIRLSDFQVEAMLVDRPKALIRARLIGVLVGPVYGNTEGSGVHCVMFIRITEAGGQDYVVPVAERIGSATQPPVWANAPLVYPWIVNALLSYVHEHRTTIIENAPAKGVRREYSKLAKGNGMALIPQPYYTVPLCDVVIDQARRAVNGVMKRAPLSYRHDRRGHERCRIARGQLPLDEKKRAKLEKRGYRIFTVQGLDADAQRQLIERRQPPKRMDEWLAIKTTWIDSCVVGPEDAPYVPAVRVSAKGAKFDIGGTK